MASKTKSTTRADRSDGANFQREVMQKASKKIMPPAYCTVSEKAMPFWHDIIETKLEWSKVDLMLAANLARCSYAIEYESQLLEQEGSTIENAKGTIVMNPRHTVLEQLSRRQAALATKVQVHSAATHGEIENTRKKNEQKRKATKTLDSLDEDQLIARPH